MIALIAVFVLWSQVGGQSHLDLMPWYLKLGLGGGVAVAAVRATMCAVSGASGWNGGTLKWFGIMLALCLGCGLVTYYYHVYEETDEQDEEDQTVTSQVVESRAPSFRPPDRERPEQGRTRARRHLLRSSDLTAEKLPAFF